MSEVDLNTFPGITEAVSNHGGLVGKIIFYNIHSGDNYKAVAVYAAEEGTDVTIIDIERLPLNEPD